MNQTVNQAKKKTKIAMLQVENQAENQGRCQAGSQGVNQESQTKNQSHEPRTKIKNQAWVKWWTKIPRAANQDPRWRTKHEQNGGPILSWDSGASGEELSKALSEVPSRVPRGEPRVTNKEPKPWTKNQGKEPIVGKVVNQDTKSRKPRTKVKNQSWAKWWTKIELVNQVMNQVVNQAKKKTTIAVPKVMNQAENQGRCQAGYQGMDQAWIREPSDEACNKTNLVWNQGSSEPNRNPREW